LCELRLKARKRSQFEAAGRAAKIEASEVVKPKRVKPGKEVE
jgi:hypothetical protein